MRRGDLDRAPCIGFEPEPAPGRSDSDNRVRPSSAGILLAEQVRFPNLVSAAGVVFTLSDDILQLEESESFSEDL